MLKKLLHVWVRNRRRKTSKDCKDKKGEIKFCHREWRAQHARATLWDQLPNISSTLTEANQHPSPDQPVTVVMYRDPISPYIFSWILALVLVGGRETESEWMKGREKSRAWGLLLNSRGRSERKRERERCRQERKWNLNGPIQLAEPHREFTWGQSHALFVSPWRQATWVCASVKTDSHPASWTCYWFPHNFSDQISGKS